MKINLNQTEIEAGVRMYIESRGLTVANRDVEIDFTAGRSKGGLTADIDISDAPVVQQPSVAPGEPVNRTAAVAEPDPKPASKPATKPKAAPAAKETAKQEAEPEPEFTPEDDGEAFEPDTPETEEVAEEAEEEAPATTGKKKNSLFGS